MENPQTKKKIILLDSIESIESDVLGWGGCKSYEIESNGCENTWDSGTSVNVESSSPSITITSINGNGLTWDNDADQCDGCNFNSNDSIEIQIEYTDLEYFGNDGDNDKITLIFTDIDDNIKFQDTENITSENGSLLFNITGDVNLWNFISESGYYKI